MTLPEGWTDDLSVTIRADRTYLELTKAVMDLVKDIDCPPGAVLAIAREFGMSHEDAMLAFDRVQGGIVRALTTRSDNCPDRANDPLAYYAFHEAWQTLPASERIAGARESGGPWRAWFDSVRERRNSGR